MLEIILLLLLITTTSITTIATFIYFADTLIQSDKVEAWWLAKQHSDSAVITIILTNIHTIEN